MKTLELLQKIRDRVEESLEMVDDEGYPVICQAKDIAAVTQTLSTIYKIEQVAEEKRKAAEAADKNPATAAFPAMPVSVKPNNSDKA